MIEKDLGFVIKRHNFRNTSIIASLYTLRYGKITGIFKGFYTLKKEFSTTLDIFTLNEFVFYPKKREIWLVSFADLICDYPFLREDISKTKIAALLISLVDKTMQLWDRNFDVFYLLKDCLQILKEERGYKILYIFLIKFLTLSGIKPELNRCIFCHNEFEEEFFFSVSKGGFICKDCHSQTKDIQKINKEIVMSFLYIQKNDFSLARRLNPSFDCERKIIDLLREFILYHLEFDISVDTRTKFYREVIKTPPLADRRGAIFS